MSDVGVGGFQLGEGGELLWMPTCLTLVCKLIAAEKLCEEPRIRL
jgi:hypothetical protein